MNYLQEYNYVKKVVNSCATEDQFIVAKKWAETWAIKAKRQYPDLIPSATDLYLQVISK